jgi:hypothetical protein
VAGLEPSASWRCSWSSRRLASGSPRRWPAGGMLLSCALAGLCDREVRVKRRKLQKFLTVLVLAGGRRPFSWLPAPGRRSPAAAEGLRLSPGRAARGRSCGCFCSQDRLTLVSYWRASANTVSPASSAVLRQAPGRARCSRFRVSRTNAPPGGRGLNARGHRRRHAARSNPAGQRRRDAPTWRTSRTVRMARSARHPASHLH